MKALSSQLLQGEHDRAIVAAAASAIGHIFALQNAGTSTERGGHVAWSEAEDAALRALLGALEHSYDGVRIAAAQSLGRLGALDERASGALLARVRQDESWQVRRAAAASISHVCPQAERCRVQTAINDILARGLEAYNEVTEALVSTRDALAAQGSSSSLGSAQVAPPTAAAGCGRDRKGGFECGDAPARGTNAAQCLPVDDAIYREILTHIVSGNNAPPDRMSWQLSGEGEIGEGGGGPRAGGGAHSGGGPSEGIGWSARLFELLPPAPTHILQRLLQACSWVCAWLASRPPCF